MDAPDWSIIPAPEDDGGAAHLTGRMLPDIDLPGTDGNTVNLSQIKGRTVVYIYPMTAQPGVALPEDWDEIPGARGCTPQSCAFRDHMGELRELGVDYLFGLSVQNTEWQREAAGRLHLPFPLLSDAGFRMADALSLPKFEADGMMLLKRMAWVVQDGRIEKVFYPVFPPDRNAADVIEYLRNSA